MKSFGGARPFIFVQPQHIKDAREWLSKQQRPDGSIASVGKLFHNGMKVKIIYKALKMELKTSFLLFPLQDKRAELDYYIK